MRRYIAQVEKVYPPKYTYSAEARDALMNAPSTSTQDEEPPHVIGGDLNIPTKEAVENDNPGLYFYWVHLNELERDKSHEKGKPSTKITENDKRLVGSLIEVQCGMMRLVYFDHHFPEDPWTHGFLTVVTASHFQSQSCGALFVIAWIAMLRSHHRGP